MKEKTIAECKHDFDCVYADPPWSLHQKGEHGAANHYSLMSTEDIKKMPIADFCKENAVCYLWVTNAALQDGLDVLKAWGFTYRGYYVWCKSHLALGVYVRNATEILLFGTKGRMLPDFKGQANWDMLPRQEHSKKPQEMYAIIERMYKNRDYLELFCRERSTNPKWYCWGNECAGGSDIYIPGYPVPEYSDRVKFTDETVSKFGPELKYEYHPAEKGV